MWLRVNMSSGKFVLTVASYLRFACANHLLSYDDKKPVIHTHHSESDACAIYIGSPGVSLICHDSMCSMRVVLSMN